MSLKNLSREILAAAKKSPDDFINWALEREEQLVSTIKEYDGIKTDYYYGHHDAELKWIKAAVVLSDVLMLYPGLDRGGIAKFPKGDKVAAIKHATLPDSIMKEISALAPSGFKAVPGYIAPSKEELSSLSKVFGPLVRTGRLVIRPQRVIFTSTDQKNPQGGRVWSIYYVDPNSPMSNWNVMDKSASQDSLPIALGQGDAKLEKSLWELSLPYIEGVDTTTLAKILNDERDYLSNLRRALREVIASTADNTAKGQRISQDIIRPEIDSIQRRFQAITQVHSLRMAGAMVSSVTVSLVALTSEGLMASIAGMLGAGGLGLAVNEYAEKLKAKLELRESPFYLFWRLKQHSKTS